MLNHKFNNPAIVRQMQSKRIPPSLLKTNQQPKISSSSAQDGFIKKMEFLNQLRTKKAPEVRTRTKPSTQETIPDDIPSEFFPPEGLQEEEDASTAWTEVDEEDKKFILEDIPTPPVKIFSNIQ